MVAQGAGLRKIQGLFGHLLMQLQRVKGAKHPNELDRAPPARGMLLSSIAYASFGAENRRRLGLLYSLPHNPSPLVDTNLVLQGMLTKNATILDRMAKV